MAKLLATTYCDIRTASKVEKKKKIIFFIDVNHHFSYWPLQIKYIYCVIYRTTT